MITAQAINREFHQFQRDVVARFRLPAPGEVSYFLSHANRFRADFMLFHESYCGGKVLEAGAYPFFFTAMLKQSDVPVTALDLAPQRFPSIIDHYGLDVAACDIEAESWPFTAETFDLVVFNETLEHLRYDPLFALAELNRVMKPGGTLLLTTPNLYAIKTVLRFALGRGFADPVAEFGKLRTLGHMGHVREYAPREVRRFLENSGFRIRRLQFAQYTYPANVVGRAARVLLKFTPWLRGYQVVLAEKVSTAPALAPLPVKAPDQASSFN